MSYVPIGTTTLSDLSFASPAGQNAARQGGSESVAAGQHLDHRILGWRFVLALLFLAVVDMAVKPGIYFRGARIRP